MKFQKNKEIKKRKNTIAKSIAYVIIPIFILTISISLIQNNSSDYLKEEYFKIHNSSYSGKITSLLENEDNGRTRSIMISNNWKKEIPFFIHDKLSKGDSLFKNSGSDSEYYILKSSNDTIQRDINKFYRNKYYKKLDEN